MFFSVSTDNSQSSHAVHLLCFWWRSSKTPNTHTHITSVINDDPNIFKRFANEIFHISTIMYHVNLDLYNSFCHLSTGHDRLRCVCGEGSSQPSRYFCHLLRLLIHVCAVMPCVFEDGDYNEPLAHDIVMTLVKIVDGRPQYFMSSPLRLLRAVLLCLPRRSAL